MGIATSHADAVKVKVFILPGQSNMEGKVQNKLLEQQCRDEKTKEIFAHLRKDNEWIVRNDVWIKFLERSGGLSINYGSRDRTGVELEFGTVVGDHYREPVLLIKTAWGGRSIYKDFRPPSAGLPSAEKLDDELAKAIKNAEAQNEKHKSSKPEPIPTMDDIKAGYGAAYRDMMTEISETMANFETLFPKLKGMELELAGFVWHQGWNDQYNGAELEYEANLTHLIKDVRKDLNSPYLPVVVGVMGQNGSKPPSGPMAVIQGAQLAMERVPEFADNVRAVRTDELIDKAAEELYPNWKDNVEQCEKTGSDHGYHYLGSAIWHIRMGNAFGKAMLSMKK